MDFDVVVAGGSVAGLLCAREIAGRGFAVLVLEEDHEIGTPEHCGGLVSLAGLEDLGVVPTGRTFDHMIESATLSSPGGQDLVISAARQGVAEISRRDLDKQIARQAHRNGAEIRVGASFQGYTDTGVRTREGDIDCKMFVDARGVSSLVRRDRSGILPCAQYEVYAGWIHRGMIRVMFDQERYPGFFAWVIPSGEGMGKVGVAGRGINAAKALDGLLSDMGEHSIIRKMFAPIWVNGPIPEFVDGSTIIAGDAAGQSKPTTAGGIYTSGMGGICAGQAIAGFLESGRREDLAGYQARWSGMFGKEFEKQVLARRILERLDNSTIDSLFRLATPKVVKEIEGDSFDFHTSAIIRLLGLKGAVRTAHAVVRGELRRLVG